MKTSPRPRWLRTFAPAGVLVASAGLGFLRPGVSQAAPLGDLERQLVLATDAHEPHAVREIARRITVLDATVERQLRLAETFLTLGLHADLERTLDTAIDASPVPLRVIDRFRAQAAAARREWEQAIVHWSAFLLSPSGLPPEQRAAALDGLIDALMHEHAWHHARLRLDQRLVLGDGAGPRLLRATLLVRTRRWAAAREDFLHLRRVASDDAQVKLFLPRWERIERVQAELMACDDAVSAAPNALAPRLDRALAALRCGLWQNAAEDFTLTESAWPMTRMSQLLLASLAPIDSQPLLAASEAVLTSNERFDDLRDAWLALRACDAAIAAITDRTALAPLRAEQARLVCELGYAQRALEAARDILRETPDSLPAARVELMALLALQRWVEADAKITAALQRHARPDGAIDAEFGRLAGLVWQAQGKHQRAAEVFTTCLGTLRTAELLRARAKSLRFLQRFTEAADDIAAAESLAAIVIEKTP